jgi:hypothetical protein
MAFKILDLLGDMVHPDIGYDEKGTNHVAGCCKD